MFDTKKALLGLLALIMVFGSMGPSYAADKHATDDIKKQSNSVVGSKTATTPKAPITIEGDQLSFSDLTGQVFAKGNVTVTQENVKLSTDLLNGNTKQTLVWTDKPATLIQSATQTQPAFNLVGKEGLKFNYANNTGNVLDASGKIDKQLVTAKNIEMVNTNEFIINNGTLTTCPAKVPDYHVSAEKVEIWPGQKLIAYNAKFWIKDKVIFSMAKYQKSLEEGAQSAFPRVGYDSDDGVFISQHLEVPVGSSTSAYADLSVFSDSGFKPAAGVINRQKNYSTSLNYGNFQDGDDEWIKKEPEFRFDLFSKHIGKSPIAYSFVGIYGKWIDDTKTSWHQDYQLNFSHDTIHLSDTLDLNMGIGLRHLRESYDDSTSNSWSYSTGLSKRWSPKLATSVGYSYTKNKSNVFDFDEADLAESLTTGISYKFDHMNTLVFSQNYDMENKRVYDQDFTWYRSLHCWEAKITYRAKRDQIKFDIATVKW